MVLGGAREMLVLLMLDDPRQPPLALRRHRRPILSQTYLGERVLQVAVSTVELLVVS